MTASRSLRCGARHLVRALAYCWASPYTGFGWLIGGLAMCTGGQGRLVAGVWEFHGGVSTRFLDALPMSCVMAITLGHTVIGRSSAALDITRVHERVHVRQYELWGPLFVPAYLGCSCWLWCCGRDPYRDNPFEREAFAKS